ncbi:hypothetical protein JMN32_04910 [Fulvivirga sp. 29W222]|uniref:Uncharacterized protein n=1 Tax=Fulvivirga marina TaxID=2494733 RepID=A0A937KB61_9BACT|nr:hypothetical protein [Fulvivirga marina]MBL6445637.1 hypothetical protein [Fulvivirga marina]
MFDSQKLCQEYPDLSSIINFCQYTVTELALIFVGTIFWVIVYFIIIRDGFKNKFVEMPVPAAASNLAWEFTWAFLVTTDLGVLFVWGLRIWFFMDLLIFYQVLKYGHKQLSTPMIIKYFKPIEIASVVLWTIGFYLFIVEGYDTSMGATSAYIITVIMASLYAIFYLSSNFRNYYSFTAAWCKMVGNALMSIYVFMHYPEMYFLQLLTVVVFILNVLYVAAFKLKKGTA